MKETICTIPINDIFMPKDGCPICRMEDMLEKQYVKFITGDAMMEPNIRIETNKKGFCSPPFFADVHGRSKTAQRTYTRKPFAGNYRQIYACKT